MTKQPKTVDAIDRETERLRAEKRGVLAALHACGGRDGESPGTLLESLDALDRALERLGESARARWRRFATPRRARDAESGVQWRSAAGWRPGRSRSTRCAASRRSPARRGAGSLPRRCSPLTAGAAMRTGTGTARCRRGRPRGRSATSWCSRRREPMSREISSLRSSRRSRAATLSRSTSPTRRRSSRPRISATRSARHGTTQTPRPSSAASTRAHAGVRRGPPQRRDAHRRRRARRRPLGGARPGEGARARRRAGGGGPCGDGALEAREGVVAPQPLPGLGEVRGPWRKHRLRMRFARSGPRAAPPRHRTQAPTGEVRR